MKVEVEVTRDFGPFWKWVAALYDEDMRAIDVRASFFGRPRASAERRARRAAKHMLWMELDRQKREGRAIHFEVRPDDLELWEP